MGAQEAGKLELEMDRDGAVVCLPPSISLLITIRSGLLLAAHGIDRFLCKLQRGGQLSYGVIPASYPSSGQGPEGPKPSGLAGAAADRVPRHYHYPRGRGRAPSITHFTPRPAQLTALELALN